VWLSINFLILSFNIWMQEVRERMGESPFWFTSHRKAKKIIHNGSILFTELLQQAWVVYGSIIYWSED
jgi:hypothetical protein